MQRSAIFTRDFFLDAAISLFCSLNYFALLINIVGYSTDTFGATPGEAGLAAGIYVIGGLFARIFIGKYVELVGRKRMLILGVSFALIMSVSYFWVSSLIILYIVRFLHGVPQAGRYGRRGRLKNNTSKAGGWIPGIFHSQSFFPALGPGVT